MTITTTAPSTSVTSPFLPLKEQARLRKQAEVARAERDRAAAKAARELREQQEAEQAHLEAEAERQAAKERAEQARRDAEARAEAKRQSATERAKRKQAYIARDVASFKRNFIDGLIARIRKHDQQRTPFREGALDLIEEYAGALISTDDIELPKLESHLVEMIIDEFVFRMYQHEARATRNNIPEGYFVGQRQEWYSERLAKKAEQVSSKKTR